MALVTINGKAVEVEQGMLLLDAAKEAGYEIPTFCYHVKLGTLATCRMCLVEIDGMRKLQPSCATPVLEGMVVHTESPNVISARESQLEFLLVNHPLDCPVCDQAGECDLQDLTFKYGKTSTRFRGKKRTFPKRDMGRTIIKEMNRCVACRRCSRYCDEMSGDFAITELNRGNELEMGTFYHTPIESEFIGNSTQLCPVGALTSSLFRFKSRVWDLNKTETICPHCSVGCSITSESKYVSPAVTHLLQTAEVGSSQVLDESEQRILRNQATEDNGLTGISICDRGRYGFNFISSDKRLSSPMIKEGGKLVETTWEKALSVVASKLLQTKNEHGSSAIGGITSGICNNEVAYVFQKFFRNVLGSNNIDIPKGYSLTRSSAKRLSAFRGEGIPVKFCDSVLVLGSSVSTETPMISMYAGMAGRENGAKLMTLMAGENRLISSKPKAFTFRKGTELTVVGLLTKAVIDGKLYVDAFSGDRNKELDTITAGLSAISLNDAKNITGVSKEGFEEIARTLAGSSKGKILFGEDMLIGNRGDESVQAIYNLSALLGFTGERGQTIFAPASGNLHGSLDMGVGPDFFPGYEALKKVGTVKAKKGLNWEDMQSAILDGKMKALYVMADDTVGTARNQKQTTEVLEKLDFLVVQDIFLTKTAELADVVFPALSYAEKNGTVTNIEGRIQRLHESIKPQMNGRRDWQILRDVANGMDSSVGFDDDRSLRENDELIFEEITKKVPYYEGLTLESISGHGELRGASVKNQEALIPVEIKGRETKNNKEYPLQVIPGRDVFLNGKTTWMDEGLLTLSPGPKILLSENEGAKLEISDGDNIILETKNGSLKGQVSINLRVENGIVVVPVNHPELDGWGIFNDDVSGTFCRLTKGA